MFVICQNILQKTSGMFIFAPISLVAVEQTAFSLQLMPFPSRPVIGETKLSPPFPMTAYISRFATDDKLVKSYKIFWVAT